MVQDISAKHRHEHDDAKHREEREEAMASDAINEARLHADNHTGQDTQLFDGGDQRTRPAANVKDVYALLADFHHDELKRISLVEMGVKLGNGDKFIDLRNRYRGEIVATGEEIVGEELLVPKTGTDYEIWNKILASRDVAETPAEAI